MFVNANVPWIMFMMNTRGWMLHVGSVLCSYAFLDPTKFSYEAMTPKCYEYVGHSQMHLKMMCMTTGFCFWTFPLMCAMVALVAFGKNFYHTRLYYEALLHRIMIMYRNDTVVKSRLTWVLVVYGTLALSVTWFLRGDARFLVYGLYIAPVVSLTLVFTSQWEVEAHIIPLPKYYETDPDLAKIVLGESVFAPDAHVRIAFEILDNSLASESILTSADYFLRLAEDTLSQSSETTRVTCSLDIATSPHWYDPMLEKADMMQVEQHPLLTQELSRPELVTVWHDFSKGGFWVYRLLHSRHLNDDRASAFRCWSHVYIFFVGLAFFLIAEVYIAVVRDFLKFERLL